MQISPRARLSAAAVLGAATVLGFAPWILFPLPVFTLAALFGLWAGCGDRRQAALTGFLFGLGLFGAGVSWVYVSLHDFGGMPGWLAGIATVLFCAYLALFPALAGGLLATARAGPAARWLLLAPALWVALEWLRGWLFTGFTWMGLGYSHAAASPLAGYAPLLGAYGVSLAAAVSAGALWLGLGERRRAWLLLVLVLWAGGQALREISWTDPAGEPLRVSLLQGNVPQELKWRPERVHASLDTYLGLTLRSSGQLIVMPETALPLFHDQVPEGYRDRVTDHARRNGGDVLIGLPELGPGNSYYNSVFSWGSARPQSYRKVHLVPFGEFVPAGFGWIVRSLHIPLSDFDRGLPQQRPLEVAGQKVAVNICYEDAFGEEIIRQLPEATLLVNVSNVAWFGRSIASAQHLQLSQMRALETGRYMLRATNTGMTAIVAPDGRVAAAAPQFAEAVLEGEVRGHAGATPYVRWGNLAVLGLMAAMLAGGALARHRP